MVGQGGLCRYEELHLLLDIEHLVLALDRLAVGVVVRCGRQVDACKVVSLWGCRRRYLLDAGPRWAGSAVLAAVLLLFTFGLVFRLILDLPACRQRD